MFFFIVLILRLILGFTCKITLAGLNATSTPPSTFWFVFQFSIFFTSFSVTWKLSQFRTADSKSTLIENGSWSRIC